MAEQEEEPLPDGDDGGVPAEGEEVMGDEQRDEELLAEGEEPPAEDEPPPGDDDALPDEEPPPDEELDPPPEELPADEEELAAVDPPSEPEEPQAPTQDEAEGPADEGEEEPMVEEHLKDAVEGNLRLKRLLSRDDTAVANKRQKLTNGGGDDRPRPIAQAKVQQILAKWNMKTDMVVKHVLDNLTFDELRYIADSNFVPDRFHQRKTPSELVALHVLDMKERKLGGGSRLDVITCFKNRWKLDKETDARLRELTHKDLRYVMSNFNSDSNLEDLVAEASGEMPDIELTTGACPDRPGIKAMGRFNRLELIDPLADCAVFGDANLTFSVQLAKHRKELGHVGRVIATTFEEIETLRERYKEIDQSVRFLEDHHAEVYHGVDCTRIAIDPRFTSMEGGLGAVYYNFPHSGAIQGFFDSHPVVNWRHENLMRLFFRALRSFVKTGGSVKVSSNMSAVGVRYSYIVGSAIENEFVHVETMPFLEWHLHRYGRSYGDRRDVYKRPDAKNNQSYASQSAMADMVYCFRYEPSGKTLPKQSIRMPPTLKTLEQCTDGPFRNMPPQSKARLAKDLHERFVKEVSGTHVG